MEEPRFPHGRPPSLRNVMKPDEIDQAEYDRRMEAEMEAEFRSKKQLQSERAKLAANAPTGIKGGGKKGRRKRETKKLQEMFDHEVTGKYPVVEMSSDDEDQINEAEARRRYLKNIAGVSVDSEDEDSDSDMDQDTPINKSLLHVVPKDHTEDERANRWFQAPVFDEIREDLEKNIATIPLSEREIRKQKLRKIREKKNREDAKRAKRTREGFKVVANAVAGIPEMQIDQQDMMSVVKKAKKEDDSKLSKDTIKRREAERLVKAGLGRAIQMGYEFHEAVANQAETRGDTKAQFFRPGEEPDTKRVKRGGFEVVPARVDYEREETLRVLDDVEIGSKEHAELLAMGEMMLSQSKARDLVDASYSKYVFPEREEDLPSWFVEDQRKNNKPQLPITREMVARIRKQFQDLAEKPIKKVAEARARKKKKKVEQLIKAKRKAQAIMDSSDISNFSKMKAVAKAYKGTKVKHPSKTYVVGAKKGQRGGYNVKFVDKRVKSDKRAMKKAESGGKKRRSHTKKRQKKRRRR